MSSELKALEVKIIYNSLALFYSTIKKNTLITPSRVFSETPQNRLIRTVAKLTKQSQAHYTSLSLSLRWSLTTHSAPKAKVFWTVLSQSKLQVYVIPSLQINSKK